MSRHYEMAISVKSCGSTIDFKSVKISEAIKAHWNITYRDIDQENQSVYACGEDYLCGGESEEEFVDRISKTIWEANGSYCSIDVTATYLEDAPYEEHNRNIDDYERLINI